MSATTPDQLAAMRRIQIGIQRIYEATLRINQAINENSLKDVGVKPLPTFYLGDTIHSLKYETGKAEMIAACREAVAPIEKVAT